MVTLSNQQIQINGTFLNFYFGSYIYIYILLLFFNLLQAHEKFGLGSIVTLKGFPTRFHSQNKLNEGEGAEGTYLKSKIRSVWQNTGFT